MFTISFYNFNKKENSTAIPSTLGTDYSCVLKEPCGILNPTISLNLGLTSAPTFNYCYIQAFSRYYYVNEWTFENGLWYASLSVDVLGTYKSNIGASSFYILRSSYTSNGRIVDTKYPTLSRANSYIDDIGIVTISKVDDTSQVSMPIYFNTPLNNGYYYLGVTGANATGVDWYMLTPSGFNTLATALYNYVPSDMTDVSTGIAKVLADPMQYIVSCYWLPFAVPGKLISSQTLKLGYYSIANVWCCAIDPVNDIVKSSSSFIIRKHPQASSRGIFLNNNPYSNYTIVFNPFGSFSLDASLMIDDLSVSAYWYTDFTTGIADLTIKASNTMLANVKAQLAVPVQLNQALVDYIGGAHSVLSGAVDVVGGAIQTAIGNIAEGVMNIASGVVGGFMGVTEAKQPKISSMGGGGNFLPFNTYLPKIYSDFYYIADEYNAEIGRPLCQVEQISNIPGYIQVLDGTLSAPATRDELQLINNYLVGGFFYE